MQGIVYANSQKHEQVGLGQGTVWPVENQERESDESAKVQRKQANHGGGSRGWEAREEATTVM